MISARTTAVITSRGRPSLRRAVASVLRQQEPVEVLVILLGSEAHAAVRRRLEDLPCRVVVAEEGAGASAARNLGCRLAETPFVAFLDERDEWLGEKIHTQMNEAAEDTVLSSRALLVGASSQIVPEQIYRTGGPVTSWAEHLFEASHISEEHHYSQTSTLLCSREVAIAVPWADDLDDHADWDWLIRLEAAGYRVMQRPEVLVRVFQNSRLGKARAADWRTSQVWVRSLEPLVPPHLVGNLTASVVARGAFASRAWAPGCQALIAGIRAGAHRSAVLWGVSGLISRG